MATGEEAPLLRRDRLTQVLERIEQSGKVEARGVRIDAFALGRILAAAGKSPTGHATLRNANFHGSFFTDDADFRGVVFDGDTNFGAATFAGEADLYQSTFRGDTYFGGTRFESRAWLMEVKFEGEAYFDGTRFLGDVDFAQSTFSREAAFGGRDRPLRGVTSAVFATNAFFADVTFEGHASFGGVLVGEHLVMAGAQFRRVQHLGPVLVLDALNLRDADFARRVRIEVAARRMVLTRAHFHDGADILVRWAEMTLADSDFGAPSLISERAPRPHEDESGPTGGYFLGPEEPRDDGAWTCPVSRPTAPRAAPPRVVSLRNARVENVVIGAADLSACLFEGAHRLDAMRIEGGTFASSPPGPRWTRRRTLAEEHRWRSAAQASSGQKAGWLPPECETPDWIEPAATLDPAVIATVYRDLRKGFEDRKDEPGAADFYYGEMEMRRHASSRRRGMARKTRDRGEHVVLQLYWLLSGYGLRAWRALTALMVTIALFAALLYLVGLEQRSVADAIVQSLEGATLRSGDRDLLTPAGQALQVALRLLGPLFLGLTILSLRGRVKR